MKFLLSVPSSLADYPGARTLLSKAAGAAVMSLSNSGALCARATEEQLFCCCDPAGEHLGSGAGTVHLLQRCYEAEVASSSSSSVTSPAPSFSAWLRKERRVVVHAGGQSRRLPAYSALGKALVPLPPLSWARGQSLDQTLFSLQAPVLAHMAHTAPPHLHTMIACGDVYLQPLDRLPCSSYNSGVGSGAGPADFTMNRSGFIPWRNTHVPQSARGSAPYTAAVEEADIVCFGILIDLPALANHGVFFARHDTPHMLEFMLQKPPPAVVQGHLAAHYTCLMDVGLWLLSDRAVQALREQSLNSNRSRSSSGASCSTLHSSSYQLGNMPSLLPHKEATADSLQRGDRSASPCWRSYDLYSQFGCALGTSPSAPSHGAACLSDLKVHLINLTGSYQFYHYGTNKELLSSSRQLESSAVQQSWGVSLPSSASLVHSGIVESAAADDFGRPTRGFSLLPVSLPVSSESSFFSQNSLIDIPLSPGAHSEVWVESSHIGPRWRLHSRHIITGVPENNWELEVPAGVCVSVVPLTLPSHGNGQPVTVDASSCDLSSSSSSSTSSCLYKAVRPYGYTDPFTGDVSCTTTQFLHAPLAEWLAARDVTLDDIAAPSCVSSAASTSFSLHAATTTRDIYAARLFPICTEVDPLGVLLRWMITPPTEELRQQTWWKEARLAWMSGSRVSAAELSSVTDIAAIIHQRESFQRRVWPVLAGAAPLPTLPHVVGVTGSDKAGSGGTTCHVDEPVSISGGNRSGSSSTGTGGRGGGGGVNAFYRCCDLNQAAVKYAEWNLPLPPLPAALPPHSFDEAATPGAADEAGRVVPGVPRHISEAAAVGAMQVNMFCSRVLQCKALGDVRALQTKMKDASVEATTSSLLSTAAEYDRRAFTALQEAMVLYSIADDAQDPRPSVLEDQIVWGRAPARIDLAGGWTDTPPFSVLYGGSVINIAVELNGQPPIQAYVKLHSTPQIVIRSIDIGAETCVRTFEDIRDYDNVGSAFSITKAALALAGFLPEYCAARHDSLRAQLESTFGGHGMEITLFVAIPAGSGLGTSSIIAGTVLQSLSEFCGLGWDANATCRRVLILEQLLTTGGGWQDQYGGLFPGLKAVQSESGMRQEPMVRWLPESIFTDPTLRQCHLLYYTGITRTAKGILAEIARGVLLNDAPRLSVLQRMQPHVARMHDAITRGDFASYGALIAESWRQNVALDAGINPPAVQQIIDRIEKYVLGAKLAGAGGGGFLYMVAKDEACAREMRRELTERPPNCKARFVDMQLSTLGVQVSRS